MHYLFYIVISFVPGILWLLYFLQKDNLHPEPKVLIIETFLLGILIAAPVLVTQQLFINLVKPEGMVFLLLVAAFIEEYFKYFAVKIHILKSVEFDEPIDAMIYCITAGLGFATIENVLYVIASFPAAANSSPMGVLIIRGLGSTILHALSSGIVGFALAFSFFSAKSKENKATYLTIGLILATIVHFLFNILLTIDGFSSIEQRFVFIIVFLILISTALSAGFKVTKRLALKY